MKPKYVAYALTAFSAVIAWNVFLIQRDQKMFNAYDKVCSELTQPHPNCQYAKTN
jgi:hypothetical protein